MDAVETGIVVVEEDEEEDSVPIRIMETSTKNESGRVIKSKQKMFAIDAARKNFGYIFVVLPNILPISIENQKEKEKGSEINFVSYEPKPFFIA